MKYLLTSIFFLVLVSQFVLGIDIAQAAQTAQTPITSSVQLFTGDNPPLAGSLPDHTGNAVSDDQQFRSIAEMLVGFLKRAMMPIAIGFLVWGGTRLILSRGSEEQVFTQRKHETFAIATGFLLFLMGQVMVDKIFFGYDKNDLSMSGALLSGQTDETAITFAQRGAIEMAGIFDFLSSFIVVIATLYIILTCIRVIFSLANEQAVTELKNRLIYTSLGLILIISIKAIVRLFTKVDFGRIQNPDRAGAITFFLNWGNFILGLIAFIAVIALIWAGILLIGGFGSESAKDTAKKIVKFVIIALILAFSAWTIIYYFLNGGIV